MPKLYETKPVDEEIIPDKMINTDGQKHPRLDTEQLSVNTGKSSHRRVFSKSSNRDLNANGMKRKLTPKFKVQSEAEDQPK